MIKNIKGNEVLIISHIADIDGMGSVILGKKYYDDNIDFILCEVKDLEDLFKDDYSKYETVYVCDLQISIDAIKSLENNSELVSKLKHFDHHESGVRDNNPEYINEVIELDGIKTCGTELFYNHLMSLSDKLDNNFYSTFVEQVRSNDVWDKQADFENGRKLAAVHAMIGPESFIELISSLDDSKEFVLPEVFLDLVKSNDDKMNRYVETVNEHLLITTYKDYKIGVTISEQYRSILGDRICTLHPEIDFILIINFERMTCSLRCIKDDTDLGMICGEFHHAGGGHKKAAGFVIDEESLPKIRKYVLEYTDNIK